MQSKDFDKVASLNSPHEASLDMFATDEVMLTDKVICLCGVCDGRTILLMTGQTSGGNDEAYGPTEFGDASIARSRSLADY